MLGTGRSTRSPGAPLLGHLMYSAPPKGGAAGRVGASALSLFLHASLLTAAVLLIAEQGPATDAPTSSTTDLIQPTELTDPMPPPPAPAPLPTDVASFRGYKPLPTPISVPTEIPPIRAGEITNEIDYTGIGIEGGSGSAPAARPAPGSLGADVAAAPIFVPHTLAPELKNVEAVRRALVRAYPSMLRDAAITGRVLVWVLVDEQGQAMKALVKQTSGWPALDEAALGVARLMEFTPGMNRDVAVKVWVAVPVDFRVER